MKSVKGHLLIASSELVDPNFFRTVVLMIEHSEEGAMGLVLNRPSGTEIKEAWEQVRSSLCHRSGKLHIGGPCEAPLMAVFASRVAPSTEVADGVFCSGDPDCLEQVVAGDDEAARFFVGCAGWGPGQLEGELKEGAWHVLQAKSEHVFGPIEDLWERVIKEASGTNLASLLNIKHVPQDPSLN